MRLRRTEIQMKELVFLLQHRHTKSKTIDLILQILAAKLQYKLSMPHNHDKPYLLTLSGIELTALAECNYNAITYTNNDLMLKLGTL